MVQYAACTCLLLQLEIAVTGVVSSIADKPACRQLARVFSGAAHQQQEIGFEITHCSLRGEDCRRCMRRRKPVGS